MPVTVPATKGPTVRRHAPRKARARNRTQRLNQKTSSHHQSNAPPYSKKRKLRDQDPLSLEACNDPCESRGYHFDSDVHLGDHRDVSDDVNRFSILGSESPDSTPVHGGWGRTFNHLQANRPGTLPQPPPLAESRAARRIFKRKEPRCESHFGPGSGLPLLPSIPTTRIATPRVKLPQVNQGPQAETSSWGPSRNFLGDIHIPTARLDLDASDKYHLWHDDQDREWDLHAFDSANGKSLHDLEFSTCQGVGKAESLTTDPAVQMDTQGSPWSLAMPIALNRSNATSIGTSITGSFSASNLCSDPTTSPSSRNDILVLLRPADTGKVSHKYDDDYVDREWSWISWEEEKVVTQL